MTNYDHWLDRWSTLLEGAGRVALDIGCGPGFDVQALASRGFSVVASDVSPAAIAASHQRNPDVKHVLADARTLEPFADGTFDVVVACLSLHYFDRADSHLAFGSASRVLREDGIFAFRVNAWDDYEFGAPANLSPWELTDYNGHSKQFFTEQMIREVLDGRFEILAMGKVTTARYVKQKSVFECVAKRSPSLGASASPES